MKKTFYEVPRVTVFMVAPTRCIMASGENLSQRKYGEDPEEDDSCFWE